MRASALLLPFFFFLFTIVNAQQAKKIEIVNADNLEYDETHGLKAQKLIGNVTFRQENVFMYCDSAYLFSDENSLDAFGSVHIKQGDSIHAYGDFLKYNGNTKMAELRKNVKLTDKDMVLTTQNLFYNTGKNQAYYRDGAKIVNKENVLTSEQGYYFAAEKSLYFKRKVVLTNPKYVMNCDTLKYQVVTKTAYFMSPSTIKGKDNFIYCEDGWYDTQRDIAELHKNSYLENKEKRIRGNHLYYDRNKGYGKAKEEVVLIDTTQKMQVTGNEGDFNEKTHVSYVTGNALFCQDLDGDTLYLHADTLKAVTDSTEKRRTVFAYHKVKFFKSDLQGRADSMVYAFSDSLIQLFHQPLIWSDSNQVSATYIEVRTANGNFESMYLKESAFIVARNDSQCYNQIKGIDITGYFVKNQLRKVHVKNEAQSIYFPKDSKTGGWLGLNKADSREMIIYLDSANQVQKISFLAQPIANLSPLKDVAEEEYFLPEFMWLEQKRPKNKKDIFIWEP